MQWTQISGASSCWTGTFVGHFGRGGQLVKQRKRVGNRRDCPKYVLLLTVTLPLAWPPLLA
jgi:hypothetical protein